MEECSTHEEEDMEHYEFGCSKLEDHRQAVARKAGRDYLKPRAVAADC